jgi:hypothetical protein
MTNIWTQSAPQTNDVQPQNVTQAIENPYKTQKSPRAKNTGSDSCLDEAANSKSHADKCLAV